MSSRYRWTTGFFCNRYLFPFNIKHLIKIFPQSISRYSQIVTKNWSVVNAMPSSSSRTKKLIKNQQINKMKQIAKNTQQQLFQELLGTDMGALAAVQAVK